MHPQRTDFLAHFQVNPAPGAAQEVLPLGLPGEAGAAQLRLPLDLFPARPGCAGRAGGTKRIRSRRQALDFPYLQVNPPWETRFVLIAADPSAPPLPPTWSTLEPAGGPMQIAYGLQAPVGLTGKTRPGPRAFLADATEHLCSRLDGEPMDPGGLMRTPGHADWITLGGGNLYALADLVSDRPPGPHSVIEALKWHACKAIRPYWSLGPREGWNAAWIAECIQWAQADHREHLGGPLPAADVLRAAKLACWFHRTFTAAAYSRVQAERGRKGGRKSKGGGRPVDPLSVNSGEPWKAAGVSRATYYRRLK